MRKYILSLFLILIFPSYLMATTYWISPTGTAANLAACSGATPLSGSAACSYDKAKGSEVVAGDIVYYRAGTYNISATAAIMPYNSGTVGSPIHFQNYNNEDVAFVGSGLYSHSIDLNCDPARSGTSNKRAYIHVHGSADHPITFTSFYKHLWILETDHNEISYCSFIGWPSAGRENTGSYIYRTAQYNWIHYCTFGQWGDCTPFGTDAGVVLQVGVEEDPQDLNTKYNLIENNEILHVGHHVVSFNRINKI